MKMTLIVLCIISSNVFAQSDIVEMISRTANLKLEAEATLGATPYRAKEQQVIKNYFAGIKNFAVQIRENSRTNRRFNSYLAKQDMAKFCSEVLVSLTDWEQVKVNCTRNRFFLCAEDVNEYPESKKTFSEILSEDLLRVFQSTPECQ